MGSRRGVVAGAAIGSFFFHATAVFHATPVLAHAVLAESTPREAQTVEGSELPIELRFNCRVDARRSRILLIGPDLRSVVLPLLDVETPDALKARLENAPEGAYRLHWQVLSVDGHITRGDISFRVSR
jgi:hypothetical protein